MHSSSSSGVCKKIAYELCHTIYFIKNVYTPIFGYPAKNIKGSKILIPGCQKASINITLIYSIPYKLCIPNRIVCLHI